MNNNQRDKQNKPKSIKVRHKTSSNNNQFKTTPTVKSKPMRSQSADKYSRSTKPETKLATRASSTTTIMSSQQKPKLTVNKKLGKDANRNIPARPTSTTKNSESTKKDNRDSSTSKKRPFSFSSEFVDTNRKATQSAIALDAKGFSLRPASADNLISAVEGEIKKSRSPRVHFADCSNTESSSDSKEQQNSNTLFENIRKTELSAAIEKQDSSEDSQDSLTLSVSNSDDTVAHKVSDTVENLEPPEKLQNYPDGSMGKREKDDVIIAKTDELILEVAKFISQIKCSMHESIPCETMSTSTSDDDGPEKPDLDIDFSNQIELISSSGEELSSIRCPSAVELQSGSCSARSLRFDSKASSRPSSALTLGCSSSEDLHGKIAHTIKMIEQEEKRHEAKKYNISLPDASKENARNNANITANMCHTTIASDIEQVQKSHPSTTMFQPNEISPPSMGYKENSISSPTKPINQINSDVTTARNVGGAFPNKVTKTVTKEAIVVLDGAMAEKLDEKTKKIFSFLDEVERSDRETLLGLKCDLDSFSRQQEENPLSENYDTKSRTQPSTKILNMQTIDSLIRKGPVELAKEILIQQRKLEESQQRIQILEETLLHQRELNMRNLRNSEKDLKKRLQLQKEEFDIAFARNEALINEMATEKRMLQEKCDKMMKNFDETEHKFKEQIKSLQNKHLEEIKRLRKAQINSENVKKQQWMGNKTQEIREMTVKGMEPEIHRIIQRHQQEMSEMRAWHADEIRDTEDRYQRKLNMQLQDAREKFSKDLEEALAREKEQAASRLTAALSEKDAEMEASRRKLLNEIQKEQEKSSCEIFKLKETMQENMRKLQVKGEIEVENVRQEYEMKIANIEKRHSSELKSLKDVHEAERSNDMTNWIKKCEAAVKEKENLVLTTIKAKMEAELREKELKIKEDFERNRKEEEAAADLRVRRLQDKFAHDLEEMDKVEKELKQKYSQAKTELLSLEEEVFSLKVSLASKEKQVGELQESNMKMQDERSNLTSVIRREFQSQLENLDEEIRSLKSNLVEVQTKHKLELEQKQLEIDKVCKDKDNEIEMIGMRVKQALARKDETIQELHKQLESTEFQIKHLESLMDEQRRNFVDSMTSCKSQGSLAKKK